MAAYNITLSDGVTIITIPEGAIDNQTDIPLVGQNATTYGDDVALALVRLLENFAHTSAPNFGSQPNPNLGQLWFDTTGAKKVLKVWDGSTWVAQLRENNDLVIDGDLNPAIDSTYTLGESGTPLRWLAIHGDAITADAALQGNTVTAVTSLTSSGTTSLVGATTTTAATGTLTMGAEALLTTAAAVASTAGLNVPHGTAPSAPVDGDMWTTSSGVFARVNGSTVRLDVTAGTVVDDFIGRTGSVVALTTDYDAFYPELSGTETITGGWTFTTNRPAFDSVDAPFTVTSTTVVANLNADLLDGNSPAFFAEDATVVHITGVETVAGVKTFTNQIIVDTANNEAIRINGTGAGAANIGYISIRTDDGITEQARIGIQAANDNVAIDAKVSGASVELYGTGVKGINVNSTAVTLNYAGNLRLVTQDLAGSGVTSGLQTVDQADVVRQVGFNDTKEILMVVSDGSAAEHIGAMVTKRTEGFSPTYTISNNDLLVGSSTLIMHDFVNPGATTLTIAEGSNVTLEWIEGNGAAPTTGNRTVAANSIVTIRKKTNAATDIWQIYGNGIS